MVIWLGSWLATEAVLKAYKATFVKGPDAFPTAEEAGLAGFQVGVWHALYAPKGTPKEAIDKLVPALQKALKDPVVVERFASLGTKPVADGLFSCSWGDCLAPPPPLALACA